MSKQPFPTGSGRITLKNSLRDYPHLLKSPNFRLLVLKCAGSYSRVFTVHQKVLEPDVRKLWREEPELSDSSLLSNVVRQKHLSGS